MKWHLLKAPRKKRTPWTFFLLVFAFSTPIWILGPVAEQFLPEGMPTELPFSSLMVICPMIAALVLVRRERGSGSVKRQLMRAFDLKRITGKSWYVPILLFWPAVMVVQYGFLKLMGVHLSDPQIPVLIVTVSFGVFFIAALGEEVGWQGYAIDRLQDRWSALAASVILGVVWALWHVVPMTQMNKPPTWIACQCLNLVVARILIVWICNNTGKSVFAAILFHAMNNVTTTLLPGYGWPYDPFVAFIITAIAATIVILLWGPKTLAQYRYARRHTDVKSAVAS